MNRIKLWLYVAIVVGAGVWAIRGRSASATSRVVAIADARIAAAAGHLDAGLRLIESRAAAVAALAALDGGLIDVLGAGAKSEPRAAKGKGKPKKGPSAAQTATDDQREDEARERAVEAAARKAVGAAERALGFELPPLSFYAAADKGGITKKLALSAEGPQREAVSFLADAARGKPRRGFARVNDGLWFGVGIGLGKGGALVLFVPLDEGWARGLQTSSGVDVTLSVGLPRAVTTLPPADAKRIAAAAMVHPGAIADAGKLERIDPRFDLPFGVAPLPLVFGAAPATRAEAVPLTGIQGGFAVLSTPVAPLLGSVVQAEWTGLALLLLALLLGVGFGFLVHSEAPAQLPADLMQAAARIERGDFGARVPTMAGKFGTLAGALNRAADAASHVAAAVESPDGTEQFFGRAPGHPEEVESRAAQAFDLREASAGGAAMDPTPRAFSTTSRLDGSAMFGAPAAAPAAKAPPEQLSEAQEEERHWEATFDDFLRIRAECGEPSDGLTFDRFRVKLEKNKETLVQKYGCRTVRFQVYVKEGRAALKATPVK
jgi:hypothetical protein